MNSKQFFLKWPLIILIGLTMTFISCGDDDAPDVKPLDFSYTNATAGVGVESKIAAPTLEEGNNLSFAIYDDGDADFLTINEKTGAITVAAESTTGTYAIVVEATNSAGVANGMLTLTVGASDDFNPVGKTVQAVYFINQTEGLTLTGLSGPFFNLPFNDLEIPVGLPTAETPQEQVQLYFLLSEVLKFMFNVPGEFGCGDNNSIGPVFTIAEDLTLTGHCQQGNPTDVSGTTQISYKSDGSYTYALVLNFIPGVVVPYKITNATIGDFTDPIDGSTYKALTGRVLAATTPTDFTTADTIGDPSKWALPTIDVVFKIVE